MSNTATTTRTQAEEYNAGVVQALATAEAVAEYIESHHAGTLAEAGSVEALAELDELADRYDTTTEDIRAALREVGDLDDATPADALAPYFTDALAIEAIGKHDGTEWTVTGVEVTVTSGGPSTWISCTESVSGAVTVTTAWGSDRAACEVFAPTLAGLLGDWALTIEG